MDDDQKFWVAIWRTAATAFCIIVMSASGCSMFKTHTKGEMIKAGKDPLEVRCTWDQDSSASDAVCIVLASKR